MVEFNFDEQENMLVCALKGRMGADVNELFSARLNAKMGDCRNSMTGAGKLKVCFDMKNVSYIASAFIRSCIVVSRQVDAGNFKIVNATPMIKKTFKIAGLDEMLHVR
jgi:anti-anti-sigma factor